MNLFKNICFNFSRKPSIPVIILVCLTIIQVHLNLVKYRFEDVIKWDVAGYYGYLPAMFIEKDVRLSFINDENKALYSGSKYAYIDDHRGNHIMKYPIGMSVLYSPFFFLAHVISAPLGYHLDGFSDIYQLCIQFSGLFYLIIGLYFLRKLLLDFFSESVTALTLLIVFFGTNLLYYSAVEAAMSHAYTFSLFSVFLYHVHQFYKSPNKKFIVFAAICGGLMVLVRPFNVFMLMVLFIYGITSVQEAKQRLSFMKGHYGYFVIFATVVCLILIPQFVYYYHVTGHFFVFSYGSEQFYFNKIHVHEFLLGFRKGWLIYTPLMILSLIGVFFMKYHSLRKFQLSSIAILIIYIYLLSSWWCWWYGGSFSQRSMIDIYPLLSLSIAVLLERIGEFTKTFRLSFYSLIILLLLLNVFQTVQYKYNIIDFDGMTVREYVNVFGSLSSQSIDSTLLDKPDYERAVKGLGE